MKRRPLQRQRGVALIMALLLTTLAVTIIASLFWRQQVQLRSLENQRVQLQGHWVLLGTLDWARRMLHDDALASNVDHLGEGWAATQPAIRLDGYLDADADPALAAQALLSSHIVDAQSFYNLTNLAAEKKPDPRELATFQRLLAALGLDSSLAQAVVTSLASTQKGVKQEGAAAPPAPPKRQLSEEEKESMTAFEIRAFEEAQAAPEAPADPSAPTRARLLQLDDLQQLPGFSRQVIERLRGHAIFLPKATPLNANTADAPALAAVLEKDLGTARALIADRQHAWFKDEADLAARSHVLADATRLAVRSHYFLVDGLVRVGRGEVQVHALIEREDDGKTRVVWLRES